MKQSGYVIIWDSFGFPESKCGAFSSCNLPTRKIARETWNDRWYPDCKEPERLAQGFRSDQLKTLDRMVKESKQSLESVRNVETWLRDDNLGVVF